MVKIIEKYSPVIACMEETFCGINPMTTLRLGYTFGALLATFSAMKVKVFKYPTKIVKRLIANKGSSSKDEVEVRVMEILNISKIDNQDSSDALAVAISYAFERINEQNEAIKGPNEKLGDEDSKRKTKNNKDKLKNNNKETINKASRRKPPIKSANCKETEAAYS